MGGIRFIGEFLLSEGLITAPQLLAAMHAYDPARLGALAVKKGVLSSAELEVVQALYGSEFGQLGEKAVQAGLLDQEQLNQLIALQKSDWQQLRANLARMGVLSADQFAVAMTKFRAAHASFARPPRELPAGMGSRPEIVALIGITEAVFMEQLGDDVHVSGPERYVGSPFRAELAVVIELSGDYIGRYVLGTSVMLATELGRRALAGLDASGIDGHDVLGELCNNVVGSAASAFAATGRELRFGPPEQLIGPRLSQPIPLGVEMVLTTEFGEARILIS